MSSTESISLEPLRSFDSNQSPATRFRCEWGLTEWQFTQILNTSNESSLMEQVGNLLLTEGQKSQLLKELFSCFDFRFEPSESLLSDTIAGDACESVDRVGNNSDMPWIDAHSSKSPQIRCGTGLFNVQLASSARTPYSRAFAMLVAYIRLHGCAPSVERLRRLTGCAKKTAGQVRKQFFSIGNLGVMLADSRHLSLIDDLHSQLRVFVEERLQKSDRAFESIQRQIDSATIALFNRHRSIRMYRVSTPGRSEAAYIAISLTADFVQDRLLQLLHEKLGNLEAFVAVWEVTEFNRLLHWHAFVAASAHLPVSQFRESCQRVMDEVVQLTGVDCFANGDGTRSLVDCFVSSDDWDLCRSHAWSYLAKSEQKTPRRLSLLNSKPLPPVTWGCWSSNLGKVAA